MAFVPAVGQRYWVLGMWALSFAKSAGKATRVVHSRGALAYPSGPEQATAMSDRLMSLQAIRLSSAARDAVPCIAPVLTGPSTGQTPTCRCDCDVTAIQNCTLENCTLAKHALRSPNEKGLAL